MLHQPEDNLMNIPYTNEQLDVLIAACVEFTDHHELYFMTGNIAGRNGVSADIDEVRNMMDWVSETDKGILEYSGIGKDNVPYFRLGRDARQMRTQGGFKNYFRRRKAIARREQARLWAPICIAFLAFIVSVLAWRAPQGTKRMNEVTTQLRELQANQQQMRSRISTIQSSLEAAQLRLTTTATNTKSERLKSNDH
jgi:outer membrane murein-binding lipoprotein Lpp